LNGKRVAFLVAQEGVEEVELTGPWDAVKRAGGRAELIAPECGPVQAMNHLDKAGVFTAERRLSDAQPGEYDAVVLPGGVANADALRTEPAAVEFVKLFCAEGKPIGVICHGAWTLVEADVLHDRTITSWPSLRTDIANAGGRWVDRMVVVEDGLVSSRRPDDLPAFCVKIVEGFAQDPQEVAWAAASSCP
jgi:protease I